MNTLEKKMLDIIKDLKENHHAIAIKAEFEAEGSRLEELIRLNEIVCRADMDLYVKIGGCEAMRDLFDSEIIGAAGIMAPMIETPFAMSKFITAINNAYTTEAKQNIKFIINAETITCHRYIDEILEVPGSKLLESIVVGRVDLSSSMGLTRKDINGEAVFKITKSLLVHARAKGIKGGIGGGISLDAIPFIERLKDDMDKFETRKVVFKVPEALDNLRSGLIKAMEFETLYLKNKHNFYKKTADEDIDRIVMMEKRIIAAKEAS